MALPDGLQPRQRSPTILYNLVSVLAADLGEHMGKWSGFDERGVPHLNAKAW